LLGAWLKSAADWPSVSPSTGYWLNCGSAIREPFTIHAAALAELREAMDRYEQQRPGLGGEFREEFEAAVNRIRQNPQMHSDEGEGVRHCPLHRFPFTEVYNDLGPQVWIAAVAHQRRRPGYWIRRRPD